MTIIQSIILGIIQGITEMLPISSSAHLKFIPWIIGWMDNQDFLEMFNSSFDVALHFGTLLALLLFFFKDWIRLIKAGLTNVIKKEKNNEGRIFWLLFFGTIIASVFTLVLDEVSDRIVGENLVLELIIIAISSIVMGILLYFVDKKCKNEISFENITTKQGILIALSQALAAAFPGVSRSGVTMTVARMFKIDRASAAKYSFLLAAPIILGAVVVKFKDFAFTSLVFWVGVLTSFIVGMLAIKFLMKYLNKGSFKAFAIYRVAIGILILVTIILR